MSSSNRVVILGREAESHETLVGGGQQQPTDGRVELGVGHVDQLGWGGERRRCHRPAERLFDFHRTASLSLAIPSLTR